MKKLRNIFIGASILMAFESSAQSRIQSGEVMLNGSKFQIKKNSASYSITPTGTIAPSSLEARSYKQLSVVRYASPNAIFDAAKKVFSKNRVTDLLSEKGITLTFFIDHNGNVKEVNYFLVLNTKVTAKEIEDLDKVLKKDVKFLIPKDDDINSDKIWPVTQRIPLDKLY